MEQKQKHRDGGVRKKRGDLGTVRETETVRYIHRDKDRQ